ncbi:MAG: 3'(2'),5'-bisphosphate nucleotidase CysQ [Nitrospiria bacterium]
MKPAWDPDVAAASILPQLVTLAGEAGRAIMEVYAQPDFGITYKEDASPLTRADMAAHHLILAGLQALTPSLPVLSEESTEIPYEARRTWDLFWLVDPLDGTREFIKRNDEFTVNIAFIQNGVPTLGVVHAPALGLTYYAARETGAYKKVQDGTPVRIKAGDYRQERLKVVISRSDTEYVSARLLEKDIAYESVRMGSSLKLCLVAEGAAHLYPRFGRTMEWDTAAADCIVVAAGGSVTDPDGNRLRYNKPDLMNPNFLVRGDPPFPL